MKNEQVIPWEILNKLFDGVVFFTPDEGISFWNHSAERISGYPSQEMVSRTFPNPLLAFLDHQGKILKLDGHKYFESDLVFIRHKDGHRMPIHLKILPAGGASQNFCTAIFRESSSKIEIEKKMEEWEQKSVLDPLTKLPNRNFMSQFLSGKIQEFITARMVFGVLFVDVDNLTQINTKYGLPEGDRLLRAIGQTLAVNLRPSDMVSRWGGEEFFAVLAVKDADYCKAAGQKFVTLVNHTSIQVGPSMVGTTVSVGATLINPGDDLSSLVVRADKLMQLSKKAGKNRVTFL